MAAIAGEHVAALYGLGVLHRGIQDVAQNTTRFLILGKHDVVPTGHDKTSVLLSSHNKPGALYDMLKPLAAHDISMTKIESRPSRMGLWDYLFYIDVEGHVADPHVAEALEELRSNAPLFKLLGSYPAAI